MEQNLEVGKKERMKKLRRERGEMEVNLRTCAVMGFGRIEFGFQASLDPEM